MSSPAADRLVARTDRVLRLWEDRVRAEVRAARTISSANLVNTFPLFLERLSEVLSRDHPRKNATDGSALAEEHGAFRIRTSGYHLEDLVREYQVLREVVVTVLEEQRPLDEVDRARITLSIDTAIREAVAAFVLLSTRERIREVAAIAHDLRGPLTGARAAAELLAEDPAGGETVSWAVRIVENLRRADAMLQTLLDAQLLEAGTRLPLALSSFELSTFATRVLQAIPAEGRLRIEAGMEIHGWWSEDGLRRILENLVDNALKFASASTPITLTVRAEHGRAVLVVHNEGSYIPPEQRATLFQLFGRSGSAARGKSGWGLGMAIVRSLAEAMGGSIVIESAPGAGTSFTVDLPLDARPYEQVVPSLPPPVVIAD